jgi:hypothetical protein
VSNFGRYCVDVAELDDVSSVGVGVGGTGIVVDAADRDADADVDGVAVEAEAEGPAEVLVSLLRNFFPKSPTAWLNKLVCLFLASFFPKSNIYE